MKSALLCLVLAGYVLAQDKTQLPASTAPKVSHDNQVSVLMAQRQATRIAAEMNNLAVHYAALQQEQSRAMKAVDDAVAKAQKDCGDNFVFNADTVACDAKKASVSSTGGQVPPK